MTEDVSSRLMFLSTLVGGGILNARFYEVSRRSITYNIASTYSDSLCFHPRLFYYII